MRILFFFFFFCEECFNHWSNCGPPERARGQSPWRVENSPFGWLCTIPLDQHSTIDVILNFCNCNFYSEVFIHVPGVHVALVMCFLTSCLSLIMSRYVAPEYAMTGHLLVKSDVYSYGVVLLELLTGRKPVDMSQPPGQENLVAWARPLLSSKDGLETIRDQSLGSDATFDSVAKVAAIASMCVQPEVTHRPFMGEVVQALKLVCSEFEEAKELVSRSCSHEDLSDLGGEESGASGQLPNPVQSQFSVPSFEPELDSERRMSASDLFSASGGLGRAQSGSFRRHSSSGPLTSKNGSGRGGQFWRRVRGLSGGSVSEHGWMFKFWPGSR